MEDKMANTYPTSDRRGTAVLHYVTDDDINRNSLFKMEFNK